MIDNGASIISIGSHRSKAKTNEYIAAAAFK
jgi:hypothetical protein